MSPFCGSDVRKVHEGHTFKRVRRMDPISRASHASGAKIAEHSEFPICEEDGSMETPLVGTSYKVWVPEERRIATVRTHSWHIAVRLAQDARGFSFAVFHFFLNLRPGEELAAKIQLRAVGKICGGSIGHKRT